MDRNEKQTWNDADSVAAYNRDNVFRVRVVFPDMWGYLAKAHERKPLQSVLDYGCGGGLFFESSPNTLKHIHLTGYDISPPMLAAARGSVAKHKDMNVTLTDNLAEVGSNTFDAVTCIAVWPNWSSHAMCVENLKTIRRVLHPKGFALFAVTNPQWVELDPEYDFRLEPLNRATAGFRYEILRRGALQAYLKPTINYNWPLACVKEQLREAGFLGQIDISEYPPDKGIAHSNWARVVAHP